MNHAATPEAPECKSLEWAHPLVREWFVAKFGTPTEPQEQGWPHILAGKDTLICAPTGSGKTLAAFLACIDALVRKALAGDLLDETEVLYVSPLKALGNDIQRNLDVPLGEILQLARSAATLMPEIRTAVRTGDTLMHERRAMQKRPPHILVTTPESLYILLTAGKSREILRTVQTVIVDEIHAVADDKRGAHLALSLERLEALTGKPLTRIGLSATQKPIELVAQFLTGSARPAPVIVQVRSGGATGSRDRSSGERAGARRFERDVGRNLQADRRAGTAAPLDADFREHAASGRTRGAIIWRDRLARMQSLRITAAFRASGGSRSNRNSKPAKFARWSPRLLWNLESISAPWIWFARSVRRARLRSPCSASAAPATGAARFPRAAFSPPRAMSCWNVAALVRAIRHGELDRIEIPEAPLDVLAQQIVAACAAEDWHEDDLFALVRRAYPYRNLAREDFDEIIAMLSDGIAARRGRYGAYLHRDQVNHRLHGRRGEPPCGHHQRRRDSRQCALHRRRRAGRYRRRHGGRRLRGRKLARRHYSAGKHFLAHSPRAVGVGVRRRREGRATQRAFLARRSSFAHDGAFAAGRARTRTN